MAGLLRRLRRSLGGGEGSLLNDARFLEAAMAAGALVASADGDAVATERSALTATLRDLRELRDIDAAQAVAFYERHLAALHRRPDAARREILAAVGRFAGDEPAAFAILGLCLEIGKGDRAFHQREYERLRELAEILGVDLERFSGSLESG